MSNCQQSAIQRVTIFIDGFNLYFGLKEKGWKDCYWLDFGKLAKRLLKPYQQLNVIKYFTSRVSGTRQDPQKHHRQQAFLDALTTIPDVQVFFGHYLQKSVTCFRCKSTWASYEEKMTDVNIATELLIDGFDDNFDTAIIISADSDLVPPICTIRSRFPEKRIIVAFPPGRRSKHLSIVATHSFIIGRGVLRQSILPDDVSLATGVIVRKPSRWK